MRGPIYVSCLMFDDSMSGILIELGLPTADTIVHNSHVLFASHCLLSCNQIVEWLANIAVW